MSNKRAEKKKARLCQCSMGGDPDKCPATYHGEDGLEKNVFDDNGYGFTTDFIHEINQPKRGQGRWGRGGGCMSKRNL